MAGGSESEQWPEVKFPPPKAPAAFAPPQRNARRKEQDNSLPIFRLRDFPMEPERGTQNEMCWLQFTESVELRLLLEGEVWDGVKAENFDIELGETELKVKCKGRKDTALESVNGKLIRQVSANGSWYTLERDILDPQSANQVLIIHLVKKQPGKAWTEEHIFQVEKEKEGLFQNRRAFGWNAASNGAAQDSGEALAPVQCPLVRLAPGRPSDVEDRYVTSRSWLCSELEQGQTDRILQFRITLDQKVLDKALEKVPYYRLFALDCSQQYFKLFIRGDESSPVMLGEFGGKVVPDQTLMELSRLTREVEGHRIKGTMETLPCLDVTILKAEDCYGEWEEPLKTDEDVVNNPQGTLEEFVQAHEKAKREPSPDREDWTPDDWADEQKDKGDACFKDGVFRDAIVYYTRALRYTPKNERVLANRSAAYAKIQKYEPALDDALLAEKVEPNWPKVYFRKGQALRGLKRFDDAVTAFLEGKELDFDNPEWEREVQNTRKLQAALEERRRAKASGK